TSSLASAASSASAGLAPAARHRIATTAATALVRTHPRRIRLSLLIATFDTPRDRCLLRLRPCPRTAIAGGFLTQLWRRAQPGTCRNRPNATPSNTMSPSAGTLRPPEETSLADEAPEVFHRGESRKRSGAGTSPEVIRLALASHAKALLDRRQTTGLP